MSSAPNFWWRFKHVVLDKISLLSTAMAIRILHGRNFENRQPMDHSCEVRQNSFKWFTRYSNTPRLYSQWLNSVIYWLINHCTDWARTNVTSFSRQFDFHDVIYHNRRRNVVFTTTWHSKCTWTYALQSEQEFRKTLTIFVRWRNRYRIWRIRSYF